MARILISEPRKDVRERIARQVELLDHEPILARVPMPEHFLEVDLYLVDVGGTLGITRVQAARHARPTLPIIGMGSKAPPRELEVLGLELDGWLHKSFTLPQLRAAVEQVLPSA